MYIILALLNSIVLVMYLLSLKKISRDEHSKAIMDSNDIVSDKDIKIEIENDVGYELKINKIFIIKVDKILDFLQKSTLDLIVQYPQDYWFFLSVDIFSLSKVIVLGNKVLKLVLGDMIFSHDHIWDTDVHGSVLKDAEIYFRNSLTEKFFEYCNRIKGEDYIVIISRKEVVYVDS